MTIDYAIASDMAKKVFFSERISYVLSLVSEGRIFNHMDKDDFFDTIILEPVKDGDEIKGKLIYRGNRLAILERKNARSPWCKSSFIVKDYGFRDENNLFEKEFFDNLKLHFINREKDSFKFDVSQYSKALSKGFCKYNFIWGGDERVRVSLTSDILFCDQQELYPIKIKTITIEKVSL
ncbi:hypothetical protein EHN46_23710 [Salmonella enterica]|nr:hypothetical protein [Salmonella enterica]